MRVRVAGLEAVVAGALIAMVAASCSPLATKGTMPPAGADGTVDPSDAPDFIAVAGRDVDIVGYVPKRFLFREGETRPVLGAEPHWPVYADDLRTLIGHMVAGKGFVPLGDDPAAVPEFPVQQGPSFAAPQGEATMLTLYVRSSANEVAWFALASAGGIGAGGFGGGMGAGCFAVPLGDRLVLLDRAPQDPGARPVRDVYRRTDAGEPPTLWVDIGSDGVVTQGEGVPDWWSGQPQTC